jgi:hypothetical protein
MQSSIPKSEIDDSAVKAPSDLAGHCALVLAKVALQTLSDLQPDAAPAIDDALAHEIETARKGGPDLLNVLAVLEDVRARLSGDDGHGEGDDGVWYIE